MPRVCIIGAGFAGLSAAQVLRDRGWEVVLVDKGRHPGGRAATRSLGDRGQCFDVGAQFWTARDPTFAATVAAWADRGWCRIWSTGFPVLRPDGLHHENDGHPRWCAAGGMRALAATLAAGLDLRAHHSVVALRPDDGGWAVDVVPGDAVRDAVDGPVTTLSVAAVIATQPLPQALDLCRSAGLPVADDLAQVAYDRCWYLLAEGPGARLLLSGSGGLRIEDPDLGATWLASQRARGLRTTGEGFILHGDPALSQACWDDPPEAVAGVLGGRLAAILGRLGLAWAPDRSEARRWRYAKCRNPVARPCAAVAPGLVLAGDAFAAAPRVEGAWCSGRAAALALIRD